MHDFIVNEDEWSAPYASVRAGVCGFGKDVLVKTDFVRGIFLRKMEISVDLLRCQIKEAPVCDRGARISSEFGQRLNEHYGCKE